MRHNQNHDHAKGTGPQLEPVRFEFTHLTANTVCVVGTFNNWQPKAKPMHSWGVGRWLLEMALPPGTYEYCLVVDGQWITDPLVNETVSNSFGGRNSVLKVVISTKTTQLDDREHLPPKNTNQ
jgi:1,4-alpha-glucan branching enzyme